MKGVDYSKQLSKERDYYQDSIRKHKESTDKRLEAETERHAHVQQKQRDNFIEDKAELESTYQKNLENIKEKTSESIDQKKANYLKQINNERDFFLKDSADKSRTFDQRLTDIKSSYKKAFDSESLHHKDVQNTDKSRYRQNIDSLRKDTDMKMGEYQKKLNGTGSQLKDSYNKEREQLVRSHQDHLSSLQRENSEKNEALKNRIGDDIRKTREVNISDMEHTREYANDKVKTLQKKYKDVSDGMAEEYTQRTNTIVDAQQRDARLTNRQNQEKLLATERDFNKQMRFINMEKQRRDTGSGDFAKVMDQQQGMSEKVIQEGKLKNARTQLVDAQRKYQERAWDEQDAFNETLKQQKSKGTALLERKVGEANASNIVRIAEEREDNHQKLQSREMINRNDRATFEQQQTLAKSNEKQRIQKLQENFNTSIKSLEEKSQATLEDVKKIAHTDKTEFMKKVSEARSKELFEIKREFTKLLDGTVAEYENRIAGYQRDNEMLKMTMDEKINEVIDRTAKERAAERKMVQDRKTADHAAFKLVADQRDSQYKTQLHDLNNNFQKKFDKLQIESDAKLKLITNDYENKLKELRASTSRELAEKDTTRQMELERIKQAYETEKTRVISSYEAQIESLKRGHQDQMDSMKDYKRLS